MPHLIMPLDNGRQVFAFHKETQNRMNHRGYTEQFFNNHHYRRTRFNVNRNGATELKPLAVEKGGIRKRRTTPSQWTPKQSHLPGSEDTFSLVHKFIRDFSLCNWSPCEVCMFSLCQFGFFYLVFRFPLTVLCKLTTYNCEFGWIMTAVEPAAGVLPSA